VDFDPALPTIRVLSLALHCLVLHLNCNICILNLTVDDLDCSNLSLFLTEPLVISSNSHLALDLDQVLPFERGILSSDNAYEGQKC
jgi:hypothetical protein